MLVQWAAWLRIFGSYRMGAMTVRVRYPPSPTGFPHVGNIRTALFNWLFARHHGGKFIVRIEDTDQSRIVEGATESIFESLSWLGLDYDEGPDPNDLSRDIGGYGPYVQSRRLALYQQAANQLIADGNAYQCYCSPERLDGVRKTQQARKEPPRYDNHCRNLSSDERAQQEASGAPWVVRIATPLDGETTFHDAVRGDITFQNATQDDFVAVKSDGFPTYHLAHVVDDHAMEITHVLRGDEWVSSTPKHVILYQALGWELPVFAHLPLILGPDKSKLSKRHGDTALVDYKHKGYLPEAMFNFLGLLGWSLDDHTEIISKDEFVSHFDIDRVLANPAVFNVEKLDWMNGMYIRALSPEEFAERARPFLEKVVGGPVEMERLAPIMPLLQERVKVLSEIGEMADFFFKTGELEYDSEKLLGKKFAGDPARAGQALSAVIEALEEVEEWSHESLEACGRSLAEVLGMKAGELFSLIRVAVTGKTAAPPLFETMAVLGRDTTLERLRGALIKLSAPAA
jgi:glutamyl-tRNA synthetase